MTQLASLVDDVARFGAFVDQILGRRPQLVGPGRSIFPEAIDQILQLFRRHDAIQPEHMVRLIHNRSQARRKTPFGAAPGFIAVPMGVKTRDASAC